MIRVNATGCSLVDNLYGHVSFETEDYRKARSCEVGDGGLVTGGLIFAEAFAEFIGKSYENALLELTGGTGPDNSNIGGPGIVPVIHANQVKRRVDIVYRFAGVVGKDRNGRRFRELMEKTGFPMDDYTESSRPTPCTDVLSDPGYKDGRGERTFINRIGAAGEYGKEALPSDFFDADFLLFGGTGLVPPSHDALNELCRLGRESGAFVMVTTVFDFRNEARMKGRPWPLVEDYGNIDLLGVDREEALKISGMKSPEEAMNWFLSRGCGAVIVTQGAGDILLGIGKGPFLPVSRKAMPTCRYADRVVAELTHPRDTTGCGDNFIGGLIDSLAHQLAGQSEGSSTRVLDLEEAVISAVAAGSVALSCLGGVYYEEEPGQKRKDLDTYISAYRNELMELSTAVEKPAEKSPEVEV